MKVIGVLIGFAVLLAAVPASGGWVITEVTTGYGDADTSTIYVQANRVKVVNNETVILDVKEGTFTLLLPQTKVYTRGTPDDLRSGVTAAASDMRDAYLKNLPPEERKLIEEQMGAAGVDDLMKEMGAEPLEVEVKKTSETDKIAGYRAQKYEVWTAEDLAEEVWIAGDLDVARELDVREFVKMMSSMGSGMAHEASPEYLNLLGSGFPVRSVHHGMQRGVTEVTSAQNTSVPSDAFDLPDDYREVTFAEFINLQAQMQKFDPERGAKYGEMR